MASERYFVSSWPQKNPNANKKLFMMNTIKHQLTQMLVGCLTLFIAVVSFAADPISTLKDVDKLVQLLANSQYYQANFSQQVRNSQGIIIDQSRGKMLLARPDKLRWDIIEPLEQTIIVKGEQYFQYDSDIDQLIIEQLSDQLSAMPVLLLSGDASAISQVFSVKEVHSATNHEQDNGKSVSARKLRLFTVVPLQEDGLFSMLSLAFSGGQLNAITILDDLEQSSLFEFSDIQVNTNLADSMFELIPPAGTDIISR